jgi:hypothetical protein
MRGVVLALAVALLGCKDKPKQKPSSETTAESTTGAAGTSARPRLDPPKVAGPGTVTITNLAATIYYGEKVLELDDFSFGKIRDGAIPRDMLEKLARRLERAGASGDPIGIALEPQLRYLRVAELLQSLKSAGYRNVALLAGGAKAIPLELLDADQIGATGVRPVVTVRGGSVMLWSMSGEEGTQDKPKAKLTAGGTFAELTSALSDIVNKRWANGRPRTSDDKSIIVQVGNLETADTLLNVLAAVRGDSTLELFPNIYLAGGI